MEEFLAASKVPELSAAGLRPAPRPPSGLGRSTPPRAPSTRPDKRSVPPPLPPRKSQRQTYKTLTGLEPPELMESLGLAKKSEQKERRMSASDLPALTEEGGWEDQTDLIPKAPGVPRIKGAAAQLTPLSLPEVPAEVASAEPPRTTLLGFGKKPGAAPSVAPGKPQLRPPIRTPSRTIADDPTNVTADPSRSKPPPPPRRTQPPPSASPKRLSQTLEMELPQDRSNATRPQPKPKAVPSPPLLTRTGENRAKPPPPPRGRQTDRPQTQTDVHEVDLGAKPGLGTTEIPKIPEEPRAAEPSPVAEAPAVEKRASTPQPLRAEEAQPDARARATTLMTGTPAAVSEAIAAADKPRKNQTVEMVRHHTDVLPKVDATPSPSAAADKPVKVAEPNPTAAEVIAAAATESAPVPEVEPVDARPPRKKVNQTLEMAIEDHDVASLKDPAPPESLKPAAFPEAEPAEADASEAGENGSAQSIGRGRRVEIPKRSIMVVSAAWVIGLVIFFAVGRMSGLNSSSKSPATRPALETEFLRITPPEAGTAVAVSEPKPCWVTRQPTKWAPKAEKSVAFGRRVSDGVLELGFAASEKKAVGLRVDPKTGKAEPIFEKTADEPITRVAPLAPTGSEPNFFVTQKGAQSVLPVLGDKPTFLAFGEGSISSGDGTTFDDKLWDLSGEGSVAAEQAVPVGDRTLVAFRRSNQLITGFVGPDGKPVGELATLSVPEGAQAGKPRVATNGKEIALVFVEKADDKDETPWQLRLAKSGLDALPTTAAPLALPEGGPGGNAIAPDIVGLPDGRWLLMWTEGPFESSAIRAQTYTTTMEPIGDPIALSPPAGNFGQALLTVVGDYTTVVFLQAVDDDFELWGAVLRCG